METPSSWSASSLPLDMLPLILQNISTCCDLLSLCLVNRSFAYYARNRLYDGSLFLPATLEYDILANNSIDNFRRYTHLLRLLGCRPELASRVRIFVIPEMRLPHERFYDIWESALMNSPHITTFRWKSRLPMPFSFLTILSQRQDHRLKSLELRAGTFDSPTYGDALFALPPLEELILLGPHKALSEGLPGWIGGMRDSLKRLHLESVPWLDDASISRFSLPNLKVMTLHDCPEITSAGVAPILHSCRYSLELLYLGLYGVKLRDLTHPPSAPVLPPASPTKAISPLSHPTPPAFPRLRKFSLYYEPSLSFWMNVQQLLADSPIEIFHIIKDRADRPRPASPRQQTNHPFLPTLPPQALLHSLGMHIQHPEPGTDQPFIAMSFEPGTPVPTFPEHRRRRGTDHNNVFHPPIAVEQDENLFGLGDDLGLGLGIGDRWQSGSPIVDPEFVRRFLEVHEETLRQFWVSGLRLTRESLDLLVHGLESPRAKGKAAGRRWSKLDRVRAMEVDEFPQMQRKDAEQAENTVPSPPGAFKIGEPRRGEVVPGAALSNDTNESLSTATGIGGGIRSIVSWWKERRAGFGLLLEDGHDEDVDAEMDSWF